jgi:hypothetical protein
MSNKINIMDQAYVSLSTHPVWMKTKSRVGYPTRAAVISASLLVLLYFLGISIPRKGDIVASTLSKSPQTTWHRPENVSIRGVVFYGRREYADILDCYLQRNLATNGGLLDDVMWLVHTKDEADLDFLRVMVDKVPEYKSIEYPGYNYTQGYGPLYEKLRGDNTIYVKVDDDIVWMDDDAIPRVVETLTLHPEAHAIGGNIINSATTNWMHFRTNAVLPYLPEPAAPAQISTHADWRASKLPAYPHEVDKPYDFSNERNEWSKQAFLLSVGSPGGPTYENHRWLPLDPTSRNLESTPIAGAEYDPFGRGWKSWTIGAQQLYSHLDNLEHNRLENYWFGNAEGIWNMRYERLNLNFFAIMGSSVSMELPDWDDEDSLSVKIPQRLHRRKLLSSSSQGRLLTFRSYASRLARVGRAFQLQHAAGDWIYRPA